MAPKAASPMSLKKAKRPLPFKPLNPKPSTLPIGISHPVENESLAHEPFKDPDHLSNQASDDLTHWNSLHTLLRSEPQVLNSDPFILPSLSPDPDDLLTDTNLNSFEMAADNPLSSIWSAESLGSDPLALNTDDPMVCCNPYEVEGIFPEPKVDVTSDRPDLKPETEKEEDDPMNADGFDLLDFVVNNTLPVNHPDFLALIEAPSEVTAEAPEPLVTVEATDIALDPEPEKESEPEIIAPVQRQPTRKQALLALPPPEDHDYSSEKGRQRAPRVKCRTKEAKYRRMRSLNNEASKRCRTNRKEKIQQLLDEEKRCQEKNQELKMKHKVIKEQVDALKKLFLDRIAGPGARPAMDFDVDVFASQVFDSQHR